MSLQFIPLGPALGAEVRGLDARHITPAQADALVQGWLVHHVLVLRGQPMDEAQQIDFSACFGPIEMARRQSPLATRPEIMVISNIRENGQPMGALPDGELSFHFDRIHQKVPNKAGVLHALEIPSSGGETMFSNMCMAYDTLPEATRRRIEGLTALNTYEYGQTHTQNKTIDAGTPTAVHPVARTLPDSGRRALFVCRLMTDRINGLPEAESRALLDELCEHAESERFRYEHAWQVGDTLIWDNRCTIHARKDFDGTQRRLMKRVTVGDTAAPIH
jgi:taurine dioxygenase